MPKFTKTFRKPNNKSELKGKKAPNPHLPEDALSEICVACNKSFFKTDLADNLYICPKCGSHLRPPARQRITKLVDEGTFSELFGDLSSTNLLSFPEYDEKLIKAVESSGEKEAVVCGTASIDGNKTAMFVMDSNFMMGSMGTIVGDKITSTFEYALEHKLPVIGYTVSGGARMQEGILSLMQMAKTAAAVKRHSDAGLLYIVVLTDPTTGGVTASFAMLGDIILAEPKALICFAGPRVIEQTIRQKLPHGFQKAEFLQEKGFIDKIINRKDQKTTLATLLSLHS